MQGVKQLLFIPYALRDHDSYFAKVDARLEQMGIHCDSIHHHKDPKESVKTTKETEESTEVTKTAQEVALKVAGMPECVQIFQQNGVQDPQQAEQICKLAAQALMDKQEQSPISRVKIQVASTNSE